MGSVIFGITRHILYLSFLKLRAGINEQALKGARSLSHCNSKEFGDFVPQNNDFIFHLGKTEQLMLKIKLYKWNL